MIKLPNGRVVEGVPDILSVRGPGLIRNHDMVHRRWCYRVKGREVTAWDWPVGKTAEEIATAAENGLHFCRSCDPLSHIPSPTLDAMGARG
jgi:hypothetical protein